MLLYGGYILTLQELELLKHPRVMVSTGNSSTTDSIANENNGTNPSNTSPTAVTFPSNAIVVKIDYPRATCRRSGVPCVLLKTREDHQMADRLQLCCSLKKTAEDLTVKKWLAERQLRHAPFVTVPPPSFKFQACDCKPEVGVSAESFRWGF